MIRSLEPRPPGSAADLAARFGTPLYVMDGARLAAEAEASAAAWGPGVAVAYSMKANPLLGLAARLHRAGCWLEVASGFEYRSARRVGVPGGRIVFNGPLKTRDELAWALREGATVIADGAGQLRDIAALAHCASPHARVGVRVTPPGRERSDRFGLRPRAVPAAVRLLARAGLRLTGLHVHLGAYQLGPVPDGGPPVHGVTVEYPVPVERFAAAAAHLRALAERVGGIEWLDLGGGWPPAARLRAYLVTVREALGPGAPDLVVEPGRALVRDAGWLLARVVARRGRAAAVIDVGITQVPCVLWKRSQVIPAHPRPGAERPTDLFGPLCLQHDAIVRGAPLPPLRVGDLVWIGQAGAYGMAQASPFIHLRPAAVLVEGGGRCCCAPARPTTRRWAPRPSPCSWDRRGGWCARDRRRGAPGALGRQRPADGRRARCREPVRGGAGLVLHGDPREPRCRLPARALARGHAGGRPGRPRARGGGGWPGGGARRSGAAPRSRRAGRPGGARRRAPRPAHAGLRAGGPGRRLRARRVRGARGAQGARGRDGRPPLQRRRRRGGRGSPQAQGPGARPAGDGARRRHGHRLGGRAGVRQRCLPRARRGGRGRGDRGPGGDLPAGPLRLGHHRLLWDRGAGPPPRGRRDQRADGRRAPRRRSGHPRGRLRLEAPGSRRRADRPRGAGRHGQAGRRLHGRRGHRPGAGGGDAHGRARGGGPGRGPRRRRDRPAQPVRAARRLGRARRGARPVLGGTLCGEAAAILAARLGRVASNAPAGAAVRLAPGEEPRGHAVIDMGEEEYTRGRPHPMIDLEPRIERLAREAADHEVAVILLDVVLGYASHPDPASVLAPAVRDALAARPNLAIVVHVCGTPADPQGLERQEEALAAAGARLCPTNAGAARLAAALVG